MSIFGFLSRVEGRSFYAQGFSAALSPEPFRCRAISASRVRARRPNCFQMWFECRVSDEVSLVASSQLYVYGS